MQRPIPVQNIYYLFCYAWDRFPEGASIDVGETSRPDIVDLFARVLGRGLAALLKRGLDRGYVEIEEDTSALRGRILINQTLRRRALRRADATCRFEELQYDVLHNQIIKS